MDSTLQVYLAFAKKKGFAPRVVTVEEGTVGCWFGDKETEKVILWFHGMLQQKLGLRKIH